MSFLRWEIYVFLEELVLKFIQNKRTAKIIGGSLLDWFLMFYIFILQKF